MTGNDSEHFVDMMRHGVLSSPEWMRDAACIDVDPFDLSNTAKALEACATCPVFEQCSELAEKNAFMSSVIAGKTPPS